MNSTRPFDLTAALNKACFKGNLEEVKNLLELLSRADNHTDNKGFDINTLDPYEYTPLAYAARGGRLDVIKYLYSKGALLCPSDSSNFLHWINSSPMPSEARLAILEWILSDDRYLKIKAGVTLAHVKAAQGILPEDENDPSLDVKDNVGDTPIHYFLVSGYLINTDPRLLKKINKINKEQFIYDQIVIKNFALIERLFSEGLLNDLNFSYRLHAQNQNYLLDTNLITVMAELASQLLLTIYKKGWLPKDQMIDLNYVSTDSSKPSKRTLAIKLFGLAGDPKRFNDTLKLVMDLAARMHKSGKSVALNETLISDSDSDSKLPLRNTSIAALMILGTKYTELENLVAGLHDNEIVNFNFIPSSKVMPEGCPISVSFAACEYQSFKKILLRQLQFKQPDLSREEKLATGWLLDLNTCVSSEGDRRAGESLASIINREDPKFFEELVLSHYPDEAINLSAGPIKSYSNCDGVQTIAWELAKNKQFKLLDTLLDRMKDHSEWKVRLGACALDDGHMKSLLGLLMNDREFELIKKIAALNPKETVELNHMPTVGNQYNAGDGFYLALTNQYSLLKLFLSRQPKEYIFELNNKMKHHNEELNGVSTAWLIAFNNPDFLRELLARNPEQPAIDLNNHPARDTKNTLEKMLQKKDPDLLTLIKNHNQQYKKKGLSNNISVEWKAIPVAPEKSKEELQKEKQLALKEMVHGYLIGSDIIFEDHVVKNNKLKYTFSTQAKRPVALANFSRIVSKYQESNFKSLYIKKNNNNKEFIMEAAEGIMTSFFTDPRVKADLNQFQSNNHVTSSTSEKSSEKTPVTSQTMNNNQQPRVLNSDEQIAWITQLGYVFCNAKNVKLEWDEERSAIIIKLPDENTEWVGIRGNMDQHDDTAYLLTDEFIQDSMIKPLLRSNAAKVKENFRDREIIIIPNPNGENIEELLKWRDINAARIKKDCKIGKPREVSTLKQNDGTFGIEETNNWDKNKQYKRKNKPTAPTKSEDTKTRADMVKKILIDFLNTIQKDIPDIIQLEKTENNNKNIVDFSFLKTLKSSDQEKYFFTFSLSDKLNIGLIDTYTFVTTIANHFNDNFTGRTENKDFAVDDDRQKNNFMKVDVDENNNIVIEIMKNFNEEKVIHTERKLLLDQMAELQTEEYERRLQYINVEPTPEQIINSPDTSAETETTTTTATTATTTKPMRADHTFLSKVHRDLNIALAGINRKPVATDTKVNDIQKILFHLTELRKIPKPTVGNNDKTEVDEVFSPGTTNQLDADAEIDYHLYLQHTFQMMRILSANMKAAPDNSFWLMRNIIRHFSKYNTWPEFYAKVNDIITVLDKVITPMLFGATARVDLFSTHENYQQTILKFETLLNDFSEELKTRRINPEKKKRAQISPHELLNILHASSRSDEQKRDCTLMIYALIGEHTNIQPYKDVYCKTGHRSRDDYETIANRLYAKILNDMQVTNNNINNDDNNNNNYQRRALRCG